MDKVLAAYRRAATQATRGIIKNWILLIASLVAYLIFLVSATLFSNFGMAGGFLVGIVQILLLTAFYSWIYDTIQNERLTWSELYRFDYSMFSSLISVAFIFFIVQFIAQSMIAGLGDPKFLLFLNLGLVFLFNAIPEVLVVHRSESIPALTEALEFTRDKLIPWFIPLLIILIPWLFYAPSLLVVVFAKSDPLLPAAAIFSLVSSLISVTYLDTAFGVLVAVWFTLFRMELFRELSR